MIVEYVRYQLPAFDPALEEAYRRAGAHLAAAPECHGYELTRASDTPGRYVVRITWASAEAHREGFRKGPHFPPFFALVQPYVSSIVEMARYELTAARSRSIADAFGGPEAFVRLAKAMHERMARDPLLAPRFAQPRATHVPHLAAWLTEVFGGPRLYSALHGDIAPILVRHANLAIGDDERARFVALAGDAVRAVAPSGEEEAVAAILRYLEWGSVVALENARIGHVPAPDAGVPRWGWDDGR